MITRAKRYARRGWGAYARTLRGATPNTRRYLVAVVIENVAIGIVGTAFALYVHAFGMSISVVGDVEGALALSSAIVCLIVPPLVAVAGYRRLLIAAVLAFGLSRLGQATGVGPTAVVALGLLYGVGDGITRVAGVAFLSENGAAGEERTMLFSAEFVLRVLAGFVGAIVGGLLPTALALAMPEAEALRWTIASAGALFVVGMLPILGLSEGVRPPGSAWSGYLASVRGFRSWGRLVRLVLPQAFISLGAGLIMPFVPLFLKSQVGASVAQVGLIQGAAAVVMALATLSTPLLARKLGLVGTVVFTQLASLPFLLVIPLSTALPTVAVAMWARGALMNMSWPIYNQFAVEGIPSADKPLVVGWMSVAWSLAWLGGSVAGGRLAETSYATGYFLTAVLYSIGAALSWALLRNVVIGAPDLAEGLIAEPAEVQA